MSLPTATDAPVPFLPPPVRRGWPRTAWCVIGLAVIGIAVRQSLRESNEDNSRGRPRDAFRTAQLRFTGKLAVGGYNLSRRTDARYYDLIAPTNVESAEGRFCMVILTGELKGASEARKRLTVVLRDWAADESNVTDDDREIWVILQRLYDDYSRNELGAPSVHAADRAKLRKDLGWFGDLALNPPSAEEVGRHSVLSSAYETFWTLVCVGVSMVGLLPIGFFSLLVLLVLAIMRHLNGGLRRGSPHGGIYAETFALWLVLFVGIGVGISFIPVPKTWQLFLIGLGELLSLSILGWPVLRGIPWLQVRQDLGLVSGRAGIAEPLIGFGTYILSLPFLLAGMLITLFLIRVSRSLRGGVSPTEPGHPIQEYMTAGNGWVWLQLLFVASVVAPIVEETMFRGVLYRQMRQATSWWGFVPSLLLSMLVVSFVFAVIHPQGWVAVPALMAIAFALTLTREWRVSLVPSMVQHGLHNGCLVGLSYLIFTS